MKRRVVIGVLGAATLLLYAATLLFTHRGGGLRVAETARDVLARTPAAAAKESRRSARLAKRPYLVRPSELFVAANEGAAQAYREDQAKQLFGLLRVKVAQVKAVSAVSNPESISVQAAEYLSGWIDMLIRVAPDLADELTAEIDATICAPARDQALTLVTLQLLMQMPELSSEPAFDCLFAGNPKEDVVLWHALDAWAKSGLPETEAITALRRTATDPRTIGRLNGTDEFAPAAMQASLSEANSIQREPTP